MDFNFKTHTHTQETEERLSEPDFVCYGAMCHEGVRSAIMVYNTQEKLKDEAQVLLVQ